MKNIPLLALFIVLCSSPGFAQVKIKAPKLKYPGYKKDEYFAKNMIKYPAELLDWVLVK